jgi:hypothetical protein
MCEIAMLNNVFTFSQYRDNHIVYFYFLIRQSKSESENR